MLDSRPTFAEIDLCALHHNYRAIRNAIPRRTAIMAVVKADAYGHGFMDISRELDALGVDSFGVAFLAEGIQLRKAGIDRPVLILGGIYPGQERKTVGYNLSTTIFSLSQAEALNLAAEKLFRKAHVHLKVDTGMGRLGINYADVPDFLNNLAKLPGISLDGVISHFASADELDESGRHYTTRQIERFSWVLAEVARAGFSPRYVHIANSAAALLRDIPGCNMVRPGIAFYGAIPSPDFQGKLDLRPVMKIKSRIAMLKWIEPDTAISYGRRFTAKKRTLIASVPIGYADGYPRSLTNSGYALVRGEKARIAGTVCMDWIMLDVTNIRDVTTGDEVILLGEDSYGNCIHAEEVASRAGTIAYEIFCGISKRVPRIYLK